MDIGQVAMGENIMFYNYVQKLTVLGSWIPKSFPPTPLCVGGISSSGVCAGRHCLTASSRPLDSALQYSEQWRWVVKYRAGKCSTGIARLQGEAAAEAGYVK